jgi:RND family efflux transporter MFP subunit
MLMPLTRKVVALSLGLSAFLTAATIAQAPRPGQGSAADPQQLVIEDATVDWYQKSDISALVEGVIKNMELRIGDIVNGPSSKTGNIIGYLHDEKASLGVMEAKIQAEGQGAINKAIAQRSLALTVVARNRRLLVKGRDMVSQEEVEKAEAELAVADAAKIEAEDTQKLAKAKLASAQQALDDHVIRAPFSGQILEEFKHEGERVNANDAVVRVGNLDTVRVWAYIPLEYAFRVGPGTEIAIQPRLGGASSGKNPIEQKLFRGVIKSVDQSIQPVAETAVRIYADLDNANHELRPGLKAKMTIFLKPEGAAAFASPSGGRSSASVGARQPNDLPPIPR